MMGDSRWERIEDGVFVVRDSCNVYAVRGPEGTVLVNCGTGRAADQLHEVAGPGPVTVILTHHFRDHTDGAIRLARRGATILGPYWEQEYLIDPEQHFRERQIWNLYDGRWDRHSPVRPLPVSGWMMDYETRRIAGIDWQVVPTPGVTSGASSYVATINGRRAAFVGELIRDGGRVSRLAPHQYNYNDHPGLHNVYHSLNRLMVEGKPDRIFPSMGEPIDDPPGDVAKFKVNVRGLYKIYHRMPGAFEDLDADDVEQVLPHLYFSKNSNAATNFVISDSGKVLSLDYGYNYMAVVQPAKHHLSNRRPILHGLGGLKKRLGIERIDTVIPSHFHDDHVNGFAMLKRLFGTQVWAPENFADILERPGRYDRPCLWHEPIRVDRKLPLDETFRWENIPITLSAMSGHTRFSALIFMEIDGQRVVHTGDQTFFHVEQDPNIPYRPGAPHFPNHVYKNGLELGCYHRMIRDLRRFNPQWVLTGHTRPYRTDEQWFRAMERSAEWFDEFHRTMMPLGEKDVHFGAESQAAKLYPYRMHLPAGGIAEFEGWVLNPFASAQPAELTLVGPEDWYASPIRIELGPREQKGFRVAITPPPGTRCRRQPVGLDLTVGGRPFGQVTEALVTVGSKRF